MCSSDLMIRRPPRSTRDPHSFPTRRSSDLHTEVVTKIMEVFRDLLNTKPTRLLSAYMNFSIEYGKRPDMAKLPMIERAPHIKEAWEKLSDAKKKTYEPSASQKKAYDDKNAIFNKKLKDFKS